VPFNDEIALSFVTHLFLYTFNIIPCLIDKTYSRGIFRKWIPSIQVKFADRVISIQRLAMPINKMPKLLSTLLGG
jgi:hypothetical protein